jgi:hypothetical protein
MRCDDCGVNDAVRFGLLPSVRGPVTGSRAGRSHRAPERSSECDVARLQPGGKSMNAIIYLVGLVVVVMFVLSLVGIR